MAERITFPEKMAWLVARKDYRGSDCLPWPFSHTKDGYAFLGRTGAKTTASRIMCEIAHGPPPDRTMDAAHSCGRGHKGCVNPSHLSWKSRRDNAMDRVAHGTANRGERNGRAVLADLQVLDIRKKLGGVSVSNLAKEYGVSRSAIYDVAARRTWAWL